MLKKKQTWALERLMDGHTFRYLETPDSIEELRTGKKFFGKPRETEDVNSNCSGQLNMVFLPESYYLFSTVMPEMKAELLEMQLNKRFHDFAMTMDSSTFINRWRRNPANPDQLDCIFVPRSDVQEYLPFFRQWTRLTGAQLIPAPVAIAALIQAMTTSAVMVLLLQHENSQVIVVNDGVPIYNQMLAQIEPGVIDGALLPNAIDFARTATRNDHNIKEMKIISMGEARDNIDLATLGITEWQPDFKTLSPNGADQIDRDAFLRCPQLYGAPLAGKEWSFISPDFNVSWKLQDLSRRFTTLAALVAVVATLAGCWFSLQLSKEKAAWQKESSQLEQHRQDLQKMQSDTESLDNFATVANIRTRYLKDFRLDFFLQQLSTSIPEGVLITALEVSRFTRPEEEAQDSKESAVSPAATLLQRDISVKLTCSSSGSYTAVTRHFEKTMAVLSRLFVTSDEMWNYTEQTASGTLKCTLWPPGTGNQKEEMQP